jgi:dipeptidyl aminopeptidase/acylaminoacyl peptidase
VAKKRPITIEDLFRLTTLEDPRISPDGRWIVYVQATMDRVENTYKRNLWLAPIEGGDPFQISHSGKDSQPRWSPDGRWLAFTSGRGEKPQIFSLPIDGIGEARQITNHPNGATNAAWSPDGKTIAFVGQISIEEEADEDRGKVDPAPASKFEAAQRKDQRAENERLRFEPRRVRSIPYRAGTSYVDDRFSHLYVIDAQDREAKARRITAGEYHHSEAAWTPDSASILTARADHPSADEPWRVEQVYRIRVKDGRIQQITKDEYAYSIPKPSPDGAWIACVRGPREMGSRSILRLAVIPAGGGKAIDLNVELDRSVHVDGRPWSAFHWTADSRSLIFMADDHGNTEVYQADLQGRVDKIIAARMQAEDIDAHPLGGIAFAASTPANPSELYYQAPGVEKTVQMTQANTDFLKEVIVQPTKEIHFRAEGGPEIQGWYLLPVDYQQGKKYPLAFTIHGGPHVMWGPSARSMWLEWQFYAARGYVAFYSNPRGGDGYGEAFMGSIYGQWGSPDYIDLMAGVDAMLDKGFIDKKKMAVTGGSYGGYMTAWIIGHTDRFACAFSARGVYNLISFTGTTDIPTFTKEEMGVDIWEDHELLWQCSPLAYAQHIKTPLMIKHGENDFRVPIEQAEQLYRAVRHSGGTVEFIRYARDGHELSRSGEPLHQESRLNEMIDWFDRYCKPGRK